MLTPEQNKHDMLADGKGAACSNRGHGLHQKTGLIKGEACLDHWLSVQADLFGSVSEPKGAGKVGAEDLILTHKAWKEGLR